MQKIKGKKINIKTEIESHCDALFISQIGWPNGFSDKTDNATITFIEYKNKIYGITCRHVVEILNQQKNVSSSYKFALTSNNKFFFIACINITNDGLANPITSINLNDFCEQDPDIAIFEIQNFDIYSHFSKKIPFLLEKDFDFSSNTSNLAIAAGYPTESKRLVNDRYIKSKYMEITACYNKKSIYPKITISSSLEETILDCSGMSGGPMFVKINEKLSLIGIVSEQPKIKNIEKNQAIITAESITVERLERWIEHAIKGEFTIFDSLPN